MQIKAYFEFSPHNPKTNAHFEQKEEKINQPEFIEKK
jgi:hypothetical protein